MHLQVAVSGVFTQNNASGEVAQGGAIYLQDAAQLQMNASSTQIVNNYATAHGGGLAFYGMGFNPAVVAAVARNNTARYDQDIGTQTTNMTLLSDPVVHDFLSSSGSSEGILTVKLNVSGYYGLPSEGMVVSAYTTDGGQPLGASTSDAQGTVTMLMRIRKPPGQYQIKFIMQEIPQIAPVYVTLNVRGCVKGEVSPSPDTCQQCLTGFYSLDPTQPVCDSCPADATCPGGASIVPVAGAWHSSADSAQVHK